MRRILLAVLMLVLLSVPALSQTSTLIGTIRNAQGNLFNGFLRMRLSHSAVSSSGFAVVPTWHTFRIRNGALPSNAILVDNTTLTPTNTYYTSEFTTNFGRLIARSNYSVSGTTFNIGAAPLTTITTSQVGFANPVVTNPSTNQAILDFDLSLPILNDAIRFVDGNRYPETQIGLENAISDVPVGGTVIFKNPIALATTLTINKRIILIYARRSDKSDRTTSALTWSGASGGTMLRINTGAALISGGGLVNIQLDGTGLGAGVCIQATALELWEWRNVGCVAMPNTSTGIILESDNTAGNYQFNHHYGLYVGSNEGRPAIGLHLRNGTTSNCTHNDFYRTVLNVFNGLASNRGLLDEGSDNNDFWGLHVFSPSGGSGIGAELKELNGLGSRSEFFYHAEIDKGMTVDGALSIGNWVFGYDTANAQPLPTITNSAELFITHNRGFGGSGVGSALNFTGFGIGSDRAEARTAAAQATSSQLLTMKNSDNALVWALRVLVGDLIFRPIGSAVPLTLSAGQAKFDTRAVHNNTAALDNTGTPSVSNGNAFNTGGTTAVTAFDDGVDGQIIYIVSLHSVVITDGAALNLAGAVNYSMTVDDTLTLVFTGTNWYELDRSVN